MDQIYRRRFGEHPRDGSHQNDNEVRDMNSHHNQRTEDNDESSNNQNCNNLPDQQENEHPERNRKRRVGCRRIVVEFSLAEDIRNTHPCISGLTRFRKKVFKKVESFDLEKKIDTVYYYYIEETSKYDIRYELYTFRKRSKDLGIEEHFKEWFKDLTIIEDNLYRFAMVLDWFIRRLNSLGSLGKIPNPNDQQALEQQFLRYVTNVENFILGRLENNVPEDMIETFPTVFQDNYVPQIPKYVFITFSIAILNHLQAREDEFPAEFNVEIDKLQRDFREYDDVAKDVNQYIKEKKEKRYLKSEGVYDLDEINQPDPHSQGLAEYGFYFGEMSDLLQWNYDELEGVELLDGEIIDSD